MLYHKNAKNMSHFQLQYYEYTQFKNILKQLSSKEVVQRYLFDLFPFAFKDNPELYWELRNEICGHLNIHPQNFTMIGSAKLGFSLSPKKIEQDGIKVPKLGKLFNEASDIDIVIVSEQLFEKIWLKLIPYRKKVYWRMNKEAKQRFDDLQRNLFFGQLRMDKLSSLYL
jgi:hypothetical protein